jgi:hypothetical protein
MKFIKAKLASSIISIDNANFASLARYGKGVSIYSFSYTIDTAAALEKNAFSVKIYITPSELPKPQSIFTLNAVSLKPVPKTLVNNILQISSIKKDTKNNNLNLAIQPKTSDFTTKISNASPTEPVQKTSFKLMPIQAISQQNNPEPILQQTVFQAQPITNTVQTLSLKTILQDKKDPGEITTNFSTPSTKGFQGFSLVKPLSPLKPINQIAYKVLNNSFNPTNTESEGLEISTVVPIVSKESNTIQTISKTMSFQPNFLNGLGDFQVHFELIGENNIVLQKISKKVDHAQNLKIIQTPSVPPSVSVINLNKPGKNLLEIAQKDNNAVAVSIFRKEIKKTKRIEDTEYVFVSKLDLSKSDGSIIFEDLVGNASDIIYRVIPAGEIDQLGSVYTNVVAPAVRTKLASKLSNRLIYAGVTAQINQEGIRVDVFSLPPGVAAVKVLVRDKTIFEKKFRSVLSEESKSSTLAVSDIETTHVFLDKNVKTGHVYEYCCVLLYSNGDEEIATGCDYIEYTPFSAGVVDTSLSLPRVLTTNKGLDVQFRISSNIIDNNISTVKDLLESQGLSSLYQEELESEKDSLNNLIAHSIRRIDLSTGRSEYFKTFSGAVFSDAENRAVNAVSPLRSGRTYRYIVSALLRTPETLFEQSTQIKENKIGLQVEVLPLKFLHPVALNQGNIVTPASLKSNYSKEPFEFGNVGNFVSQDVTVEISQPRVFNVKVIRFNEQINILRWNVSGAKDLIDHFLIITERFGAEEIIGKAHTRFPSNVIQFLDRESPKEPGSFRYKIIPVYKTYEHGPVLVSDEVII